MAGLKPPAPFEVPIRDDGGQDHHHDRERISKHPLEFRHAIEVHAVDRPHDGRRQEQDRRDGEDLDDRILFDVDQPKRRIQKEIHFPREKRSVIAQRLKVLTERPQMLGDFGRKVDLRRGKKRKHPAQPGQALS